jgi:Zn-dependent peptidase ImmA (M78 family)
MLTPSGRLIVVNAADAANGDVPTRRHRFTIAHEVGHWNCHARPDPHAVAPSYCRTLDVSRHTDRDLEREANVFGTELVMPEAAVREAWAAAADALAAQWRLYRFGLIAESLARFQSHDGRRL